MKMQPFLMILTVANLALLVFTLTQNRILDAQGVAPVLRARALEIVDGHGRARATISVLAANPAVTATDGKPFPETVVFRLIDPRYGPVVKISGSERGAGLGLGGDSEAKYAQIEATDAGSFVTLTDENGRQQVIRPSR
jgi:hypothetical protein